VNNAPKSNAIYLKFVSLLPSHEFEEVFGETSKIYNFGVVVEAGSVNAEEYNSSADAEGDEEAEEAPEYNGWSEKRLPMAVFKPFAYSAGPTQLMTAAFWMWLVLGIILHAWKYISSKKIREAEESANAEKAGVKTLQPTETAQMDDINQAKEEVSTDEENSYNELLKIVAGK
jgi:high-affinity iron transporter